jgi:Vitamin K-dependent gamma-carboxylase
VTAAWEQFWFEPEATSTLAVVRIAFGVLVFAWTLSLAPDLGAFFGQGGVLAAQPGGSGVWGVLGLFHTDFAVEVVFVVMLLAAASLTVGYQTRLASALVFVGILSLERRDPYVFNTGDGLLRLIAFYLMLAPAGEALSLDRLRLHRENFWAFPRRSPWTLRLMQVQLSVLYLSGLWVKLQGTTWNNGTAVSYAMRISDLNRFPLPGTLTHSLLLSNLLTFGTLAVEASVPVLVWNRRLRLPVLLVGASLHLGIEYSIRVGFFSLAMLTLYLAFLDPDWTARRLRALRRPVERRSAERAGAAREAPTPANT